MWSRKIASRMFSSFAVEDIEPMSKVFTTWSDVLKIGTLVIGVSQAFFAVQPQLIKVETDKEFRELKDTVKTEKEELKKDVVELKNVVVELNLKVDQLLAKKP